MSKRTESHQQDQQQQESPQTPSRSTSPPTNPPVSSHVQPSPSPPPTSSTSPSISPLPASGPSSSQTQQQQLTEEQQNEAMRLENLRQFNLLLTPAFSAFSQISDGLFLTGVGGMSVDNFRKNKITSIINCTQEAPNWRLSGVECMRIPIDDVPEQDLTGHLDRATDRINAIITSGGKVVVHCVAGVSRSAAIVIGYLIKYRKMSLHDAYNHVQTCRRVIRPNNGFFHQLIAFELKIHGKTSVKMIKLKREDVLIEVPDFFQTEHKRFILMEIVKARASALKLAQAIPTSVGPCGHSSKPVNKEGGTVKVQKTPKSPNPSTSTSTQPSPSTQLTSRPSTSPLPQLQKAQPQDQPVVHAPVQSSGQQSAHALCQSPSHSVSPLRRVASAQKIESPVRPSFQSTARSPRRTVSRTSPGLTSKSPSRSPVRSPSTASQSQVPAQTQSQSQIQTRPQSRPPSQ